MKQVIDARDAGAFISSALDDFGLDPYAFRVYARIVRRAGTKEGCFESLDNMAKACKMNRKTVYAAIKTLLSHRMIEKEEHVGKPSTYWITPIEEWISTEDLYQQTHPIPDKGHPTCTVSGTPPIPNQVHHLYQIRDTTYTVSGTPPIPNQVHKGNPIKEIPLREPIKVDEDAREDFLPVEVKECSQIRTDRRLTFQKPNFWEDGPWGRLARDLGLDPEVVCRDFERYLHDCYRDRGLKDLEEYCSKIISELFRVTGSEATSAVWKKFERHYREHRSVPTAEPRKVVPGCEIKLPELPNDEEAEKGRLELSRRLSERRSSVEVSQ